MNIWDLCLFLSDIVPDIEVIDGFVFLNRDCVPDNEFRDIVGKYDDLSVAQKWINSVPIDDFLDSSVVNWEFNDESINSLLRIYEKSWLSLCKKKGFDCSKLSVSCLSDEESGDLIFRLNQS